MIVRDRTLRITEYKGRPTQASHADCPCRPCYNAHDCGHVNSQGKWESRMHCATNWNSGCPENKEPNHIFSPHGKVCKRCGARRP